MAELERDADLAAASRRGWILRSDDEAADEPGRNGRVEAGLEPLPRQSTLLRALERAHAELTELIEGFDGLPEAYVAGGRSWTSLRELETACELIHSAHSDLIGG